MIRVSSIYLLLLLTPVAGHAQIPPGFEVVGVATGDDQFGSPRLNNCGEAVFHHRITPGVAEIFRYDNGKLTQVTDNDSLDGFPDINDAGAMMWSANFGQVDGDFGDVVRFEDGELTMLGPGNSGSINNLGHIAWKWFNPQTCASESNIFFYDGASVEQVTDDGLSNQTVGTNDSDAMTWTRHYFFCADPWVADIMFLSGGAPVQLTPDPPIQQAGATINNLGQVAFMRSEPPEGGSGIWLWEGGEIRFLIIDGANPRLNNLGDIHFLRFDGAVWQGWLYIDGNVYQLTDEPAPVWNTDGDINDAREVVWRWWNLGTGDRGVRYMRRIRTGEADFDGHIDLRDFAAFQNCVTGPGDFDGTEGGFDRLCDCRFLDLDHDRDVDADDFALFQPAMDGPL